MLLVARTKEKLDEVQREIEQQGGTAFVHTADLSDPDDIDRLATEVLSSTAASTSSSTTPAARSAARSAARTTASTTTSGRCRSTTSARSS